MHDVVVIGAGPSGSAAAIELATRGVDVLLLDRAEFPRDKACGDMLSRTSLRELERLGLSDLVDRFRPHAEWKARFQSPSGNAIEGSLSTDDEEGRAKWVTIPRLELDAALVQRAEEAGATILQRASVDDLQINENGAHAMASNVDGGQVDAHLVIVATGSSGEFALNKPDLFALRGYFEADDSTDLILRFDPDLLPGYSWQFPIREGLYNIGLGMPVDRVKGIKADDRLNRSPLVAGKRLVSRFKGTFLNTSFSTAKAHNDRALWVGDAAGLIQPHLGEGISPALRSGAIAAMSAIEFLEKGVFSSQDLVPYTRRLHTEFDREMRLSRWLYSLMKHPRFLDAFGRILAS